MTKILAIAASTRTGSHNKRLLEFAAAEAARAGAEVTVLDYAACDAPIYHGDHSGPMPDGAAILRDAIIAHDGIMLASPEYNWSIPGGLKNLIDWLSTDKSEPFRSRTALLMCASPSTRGGITGLQHLRTSLEVLRLWIYPQLIGIGTITSQFAEGGLQDSKDKQHLVDSVRDFVRATKALRAS